MSCCRHDDSVMAVAFHPIDSKLFLSCAWNGKVRMQCADPPRVIAWKQTQSGLNPLPIHSAAFSGQGDKIFVGAMFGRVRQYHLPASMKLEYHAEVGMSCL
jgi:WD40 repeat protein